MTEYDLHTQGATHHFQPPDGLDPMRNLSNGTDMTLKRYGLGREHINRVGSPAIVESPDGEYVRFSDHERLLAACITHNEMLLARLRRAEGKKCKSEN